VELAALLAIGLATGLAGEARHGPGCLSWVESRRSKWVVIAWAAALVLVLAVPVSLSRGGVVSVCAGLVVFGGLRLWTRGPSRLSTRGLAVSLVLALLVTVAIGAALPAEARSRVLSLTGITSDQSGSYRIGIWRDTLRLVASSPLTGSGFGAYAEAFPRFRTTAGHLSIEHAENDHLEFLAEGGGLGTLLGGLAALALFLYGLKGLRAEEHRLAQAVLAAALAGGAAICAHSAFDFNLRIPSNSLGAGLLAALATASTYSAREPGTARWKGVGCWVSRLLLVGSLLVATLTPWREPRWQTSALARVAMSRTDLRRSSLESDATSLLRQRPALGSAWVQLGWLRLPRNREDAGALAGWGVALDPQHEQLAVASAPLREVAP
jgi:O-antigen ligase